MKTLNSSKFYLHALIFLIIVSYLINQNELGNNNKLIRSNAVKEANS